MSSTLIRSSFMNHSRAFCLKRQISTSRVASLEAGPSSSSTSAPKTHYKITLQRSAIALPSRVKATLESLGIHRRLQTVYHEHNPINAGKILRVKELVTVENVSADEVRTKTEQRRERRPSRGFVVKGSKLSQEAL
ncbi:hypothetical protein BXZ70DRAFT_756126 [Cristinia sonorae]|uniref:Large ribosomal subunit protein uL30m n=1 Tax=Cristinia sonorae TaxID=1940300 RepID=A0A8K0UTE7_9AGAR|nr:hypothetical protein BXZ70DRAFT_756126 [Cristinia sonorae]